VGTPLPEGVEAGAGDPGLLYRMEPNDVSKY
jgi:hypothetical protein